MALDAASVGVAKQDSETPTEGRRKTTPCSPYRIPVQLKGAEPEVRQEFTGVLVLALVLLVCALVGRT